MLRSYRRIIFAVFGSLALIGSASSQGTPADSKEVQVSANQSIAGEDSRATNAVRSRNVTYGEKSIESDCGSPKECRAEQREKDSLIAQQVAAKAAADQARTAWWQTGVGAAGVILLILTILYSHTATKAAVEAVKTLVGVERARIAMIHSNCVVTRDGRMGAFRLILRNVGRTNAALRESCVQGSASGRFADFEPKNITKFNQAIDMGSPDLIQTYDFTLGDEGHRYIVGYYKFTTIFSKRVLTDYFCVEIGDPPLPFGGDGVAEVVVPVQYHTDLDWPPDEE